MVSFRTCFLAVYASNGIIRALFLPLCYITLSSPFTLLIAYYLGPFQTLQSFLPEEFSVLHLLPHIALSTAFLFLPTRLLSAPRDGEKSKHGGRKRRVQSLPYWIPAARHFWTIIFDGEGWLKDIRESSTNGIVAFNTAGTKHNVIFLDTLLDQVYQNSTSLQEPQTCNSALLRNAFSMSKHAATKHFELLPSIEKFVETDIFAGSQMQNLVESSLNILSESLPDLITFNSSIVDQMQWERVSNVELTDGTSEVECDLFTLINEFCCNAVLPPLMGTQFTESYQLLATDLATLNQRFWALALGLPRLSPVQGLPAAALAQKRLTRNFANFFADLTNPPVRKVPDDDESVSGGEETDADLSTAFTKLNEFFSTHNLPMETRASIALHFVHAIVTEVVPLVFWTLLHIFSSSAPQEVHSADESALQKIKEETKAWASAIQPPSIHPSFPAPPEIRFKSVTGLLSPEQFPYLSSCINESRRMYNSSNSILQVTKPITLEAKGVGSVNEQEQWELDVGSYVDIGLSQNLINLSPANHISPLLFKFDRFIITPAPISITSLNEPASPYTNTLLMSLTAGIIQLWELTPAPKKSIFDHMQEIRDEASMSAEPLGKEEKLAKEKAEREKKDKQKKRGKWVIPKAIDGAKVKVPKTNVRVRIRRREGLPTSNVVRRIG